MSLTRRAFKLHTPFEPTGDQPRAIEALAQGVKNKKKHQVLMGVTGSGKTYTMANVIAQAQMPALVLCHNKTLAAQLFAEFKEFFPENAVEYFVSYYDYYQPEAYIPSTDTFIEKDSAINEEIDKLRHSATRSLLERSDVLIVSSISCIYGLGSPEAYEGHLLVLDKGQTVKRQAVLHKLIEIQYQRNDIDFHRGTFRVRGDTVEIFPSYEEDRAIRVEFFDEEVEAIHVIDPLRGVRLEALDRITIFPASHYVTTLDSRKRADTTIREELRLRLAELQSLGKLLEAQRLSQRTLYDLEMIEQLGFCQGIENYSRHLTGRPPGAPPPTLLEYFPKNWLLFIDESHVTVPQIGGMYRGDRARKVTLVEHGFRLPSALDNRPLNFEEWEKSIDQVVYVSATPGDYELRQTGGEVVEQVIRPTGLIDPEVEVRPAQHQVDDLHQEIVKRIERKERVLVTTLTKKLAEDLTQYFQKKLIKVKYLHSDIETLERIEILRDLRLGVFDVLIGINLLREGLDLPEVSLVAILDADKEGFLRSTRSLIQTIGRAARNSEGRVILYADKITESMRVAMDETARRRKIQADYNAAHGITPRTVQKAIRASLQPTLEGAALDGPLREADTQELAALAGDFFQPKQSPLEWVVHMEEAMRDLAKNMEFEKAAELRDRIKKLKSRVL